MGRRWRGAPRFDPRDETGIGLVEAMVAALVLIVGIGAAITVFVSSGHAGATAERHQAAVALAQEELERIRSLPYGEIGLASLAYPPSDGLGGELPNPADRVQGPNYVPANASDERLPAERLVASDAGRTFSLAPYETREMESRSGVETAHIFRFVTWRDEECRLLDLQDLNLSLSRLGGTVTSLLRNLEVGLAGQGLIATAESSQATLLGLDGLTNPVLSKVDELLALIDELLEPARRLVNEVLVPALGPLESSLAQLTGQLDLCDIDLSALQRLETVNAALEALQAPLQQLTGSELAQAREEIEEATDAAVEAAERQAFCRSRPLHLNCLVGGLLGTLISTLSNLVDGVKAILIGNHGVIDKIDTVPPDVNGAIEQATRQQNADRVLTDIGQIPQLLNSILAGLGNDGDENSKRVVVAVVLEHGGPAGPRQPIWMSTVVTDPDTGLLMR